MRESKETPQSISIFHNQKKWRHTNLKRKMKKKIFGSEVDVWSISWEKCPQLLSATIGDWYIHKNTYKHIITVTFIVTFETISSTDMTFPFSRSTQSQFWILNELIWKGYLVGGMTILTMNWQWKSSWRNQFWSPDEFMFWCSFPGIYFNVQQKSERRDQIHKLYTNWTKEI